MSIRGIGTDVLEIKRIIKPLRNPRFCKRVFTEAELAYITRKGNSGPESAAGFFCVKEAAMKALGTGMYNIHFNEIEVCHLPSGAPSVMLHAKAKTLMDAIGGHTVHITISHTREIAVATVIIED